MQRSQVIFTVIANSIRDDLFWDLKIQVIDDPCNNSQGCLVQRRNILPRTMMVLALKKVSFYEPHRYMDRMYFVHVWQVVRWAEIVWEI